MVEVAEVEVIYATFHVDVGETPFFVALDYTRKKVCPPIDSLALFLSSKPEVHPVRNASCNPPPCSIGLDRKHQIMLIVVARSGKFNWKSNRSR